MDGRPSCPLLSCAIFAWCAAAVAGESAADIHSPAVFTVTDKVLATNVEPVGAVLGPITGGMNFAVNAHMCYGFEPVIFRKMFRLDRAGENWIEWDNNGSTSMVELVWTGFGNGATIRFYRLVDKDGQTRWPYAKGLHDAADADHVVFLGEDEVPGPSAELPQGGWIANRYRCSSASTATAISPATRSPTPTSPRTARRSTTSSRPSAPRAGTAPESNEVSATPDAGIAKTPKIYWDGVPPAAGRGAGRRQEDGRRRPERARRRGALQVVRRQGHAARGDYARCQDRPPYAARRGTRRSRAR